MLKRITVPVVAIMAIIGYPVHAQEVTVPNTAASFSASAIPVTAGAIDFWAKLTGFSGEIPLVSSPHFFMIHHLTTYTIGFTPNDGLGNKGLIGMAVGQLHAGSSSYFTGSDNTYEDILGAGGADTWHHYTLKGDQDGLAEVPGQKVAVYFDDVLNSTSWNGAFSGTFPALPGGALNLITGNAGGGRIAIDGLKI